MGLLNRIKMLWRAAVGSSYSWPAMDIVLPGERYLHLVGSIHMGTRDMAPPPAKLLKKIRQADALIVEADISGNETPFSNLPTYPPLAERLSDAQLSELAARSARRGDGAAGGYADPLAHQRPFTAGHDRLVAGATAVARRGIAADDL